MYVADSGNCRIRKISNGIIKTVAGNGPPKPFDLLANIFRNNRRATEVHIGLPADVAVDSAGNLYIADHANGRIRKISNGVIVSIPVKGF